METSANRSRAVPELLIAVNSADAIIYGVLCSIVKNVAIEMRAKACCLAVFTPDRRFLRHVACHGLSDDYITKGFLSVDKSISEALEGKAVCILDAPNDPRIQYPEKARQEGIASILAVPVMFREELLGVMRVYTAHPRRFTQGDVQFVETAASMGAKALEDAASGGGLHRWDEDGFRQQLVEMEWARMPGQCP